MFSKLKSIMIITIIAVLTLTGCSSSNQAKSGSSDKTSPPAVSTEPVKLTLYTDVALTDAEFQKIFVDWIQKKYPYISFEKLSGKIEDLVAANTVPDLIFSDIYYYLDLKQLGLPYDMSDLIQKNLDLAAFSPESVQAIRSMEGGKSMNAVPFSTNAGALFYNKDIFDKFGVSYPKDGMTWDEVLELSKRMTRQQDGKQYIGWDPGFPDAIASPYTQIYVDPKTNKALIDTPIYKKVFELLKQVYDQPGFIGENNKYNYGPNGFIKDQNVGMMTEWVNKLLGPLIDANEKGTGPNWDMATIPNFPDKAGMGRHEPTQYLFITSQSKHKDQAMQVIQSVTSREAQLLQSRGGRITVLNDPEVKQQFGMDIPALKGKNTASIFKFKPSPTIPLSPYLNDVQKIIRQVRDEMIVNKKDINTALKEAQETADKKIAELMAK